MRCVSPVGTQGCNPQDCESALARENLFSALLLPSAFLSAHTAVCP
jgi:hypothetical protein